MSMAREDWRLRPRCGESVVEEEEEEEEEL